MTAQRSFEGDALSWHVADRVLEVRLHAPPNNEIGTTMLHELEVLTESLAAGAAGARALLIYPDQRSGFSAGADLRELHAGLVERSDRAQARVARLNKRIPGPAQPLVQRAARRIATPLVVRQIRSFLDRIHGVFDALDTAPLTTVAAIHGVCFGGGFELALTADVLVADKTARFCFPELRLGIVPGFGGIPRLKRDLGNGLVRDLILTGRSVRASRAFEVGLVSQVVAKGRHVDVARRVAAQAAKFDPAVVQRAKAFTKPIPRAELEREKDLFCELISEPRVFAALSEFVGREDAMTWLPKRDAS